MLCAMGTPSLTLPPAGGGNMQRRVMRAVNRPRATQFPPPAGGRVREGVPIGRTYPEGSFP